MVKRFGVVILSALVVILIPGGLVALTIAAIVKRRSKK